MISNQGVGLFIGAGASYEAGMPLVGELTNIIKKNILFKIDTKLFTFKDSNQKEDFIQNINSMDKDNYEDFLGTLEGRGNDWHGIVTQLTECIHLLLFEIQGNIRNLFLAQVLFYEGLISFFNQNGNVSIFTLNHDTLFEEILKYFKIPYKDCFFDNDNHKFNDFKFKTLTSEQLKNNDIDWFSGSEKGVNILKLHGAIDIFSTDDRKKLLKIDSCKANFYSIYDAITKLEQNNIDVCNRDKIRVNNEITIEDSNNVLQFLRRSLLSGTHKYQNSQQIMPLDFLNIFDNKLHELSELIIIGYSFGDSHIDDVILKWLSRDGNKIKIYDPHFDIEQKTEFLEYAENIQIFKKLWGCPR